jgi:hypothetical protein
LPPTSLYSELVRILDYSGKLTSVRGLIIRFTSDDFYKDYEDFLDSKGLDNPIKKTRLYSMQSGSR